MSRWVQARAVCTLGRRNELVCALQTAMNPFHSAHTTIRSPVFDSKVRASAKKYL